MNTTKILNDLKKKRKENENNNKMRHKKME